MRGKICLELTWSECLRAFKWLQVNGRKRKFKTQTNKQKPRTKTKRQNHRKKTKIIKIRKGGKRQNKKLAKTRKRLKKY